MFSKKSLHISLAFILLIALATLGLAYGAWTDALNINGTVTTGELDVELQVAGFDPAGGCSYSFADGNDTINISATNVTPGMVCWTQLEVKNTGTVPILIDSLNIVEDGAGYWDASSDCNFVGVTLEAGSFGGECLVWAEIPDDNSSQNQDASIAVTVNAIQAP